MLLDGIYVVFIHMDFELDILQMCWCSLFLCSVVMRGSHQLPAPQNISSWQNRALKFPQSLSLIGECNLMSIATWIRPLLFMQYVSLLDTIPLYMFTSFKSSWFALSACTCSLAGIQYFIHLSVFYLFICYLFYLYFFFNFRDYRCKLAALL